MKEYTLGELSMMGPDEAINLNEKDFVSWEKAQKRNTRINKVSLDQMKTMFDQNEADVVLAEQQARVYKSKRDIQVYLYEMMEATVKSCDIHDKFREAEKVNKERAEQYMRESAPPSPPSEESLIVKPESVLSVV